MITKDYAYKIAFEEKNRALKEKESLRAATLSLVYEKMPRLTEIDRKLGEIGANIAIFTLSGKDVLPLKEAASKLTKEKKALLKSANVPEIEYNCLLCKDTGRIKGKICECIKKDAAKIITAALSKEMPLLDNTFETFNLKYYPDKEIGTVNSKKRMSSLLELCQNYAHNFNPQTSENLLFMGEAGLGKTHLTLSIVNEVIKKGYIPFYASADNLFALLESEKFEREGKGNREAILNCDLLVIDDLGTEMVTQFTRAELYTLINTRILSGRPTIINTNLSIKELENLYTARITSRLIGSYSAHKFVGVDIRQLKRMEEK